MGRQRNATSAYQLKAKERQAEALELRKAGLTYPEIAKRLGYSGKQAAYRAVATALAELAEETSASADQLRELENSRLDRLHTIAWQQATQNRDLTAIDRAIRISERRAKLYGLDLNEKRQADAAAQQAELTAQTAEAIYQIITRVLDGLALTAEQQAKAPELIMKELTPKEDTKEG